MFAREKQPGVTGDTPRSTYSYDAERWVAAR